MSSKTTLAPICLFTYNRLDEIRETIKALQNNYFASQSELFVFSDGWKNYNDREKVISVRDFLKTITGFKKVYIIESELNKGLANSIISGVTGIFNEHEKVIILEDDLITSPNFLNFMNQSLTFYEKKSQIFSITGYSMDLPSLNSETKDYYLGYRASSWGWATWKNRWSEIDWEVKNYENFKKSFQLKNTFRRGGNDLPRMLHHQMTGKIDSWAIRWCFHQFERDQLTVFPTKSKVKSIGFGQNATHTKKTNRFDTTLDTSNKVIFKFDNELIINKKLVKEFKVKFSLYRRLLDRF